MTSRKDQFVHINEVAHGRIHFADDNNLIAKGNGQMVLKDYDNRDIIIEDVLHVPGLNTNLFDDYEGLMTLHYEDYEAHYEDYDSLGQLLQKRVNDDYEG